MGHAKDIKFALALLSTLSLTATANAVVIEFPPLNISNNVAANVPAQANVWTGLSQSFTAQDPNVTFGFYVFLQAQVPTNLLYSLYSGDGTFSTLLAQQAATLSAGTALSPTLLTVDFSSINLLVNAKYTVGLTLPTQGLPVAATYSNASALYAGLNTAGTSNPYQGGSFYFVGSSYSPASFADRDLAFRITSVPEPNAFALMAGGLGLIAFARASSRQGRRCALRS